MSGTFVELTDTMVAYSDALNEQTALNSRVVVEQAKGKLAERLGVDTDQAFSMPRGRAYGEGADQEVTSAQSAGGRPVRA